MSKRDEEIKRLISYAKGHGLKVTLSRAARKGDAAATWSLDGSEIEVFIRASTSKTSIILSLMHELGHHLWFVHERDRKPDLKFEDALAVVDRREASGKIAGKRYRKKILNIEIAGTTWWDVIYKDTNLSVPKWKVDMQKEFDIWNYQVWCDTGVDATQAERYAKFKELTEKWKGKVGDEE